MVHEFCDGHSLGGLGFQQIPDKHLHYGGKAEDTTAQGTGQLRGWTAHETQMDNLGDWTVQRTETASSGEGQLRAILCPALSCISQAEKETAEAATQVPVAPRTSTGQALRRPMALTPPRALPTGKTHVEGIGTGASPHSSSTWDKHLYLYVHIARTHTLALVPKGWLLPSSDTSDHSGLGNSYWPIRIRVFIPGEMARP